MTTTRDHLRAIVAAFEAAPAYAQAPRRAGQSSSPITYGLVLYARVIQTRCLPLGVADPPRRTVQSIRRALVAEATRLADYADWLAANAPRRGTPDWVANRHRQAAAITWQLREVLDEAIYTIEEKILSTKA